MKNYIFYLILFLMVFFFACEEESSPTKIGTDPNIEEIKMRDKWNSASEMLSKVEVKVTDPQGFTNITGVFMELKNQANNQVVFSDSLYDDGAFNHSQDGDVIAGDGIFSNRFSSVQILSGAGDGDYMFSFQAFDKDNHISSLVEQTAIFGPNARPQIVNVSAPDTLFSGTPGQIFEMAVSDSDGIDDVIRGYFEVWNDSGLIDIWDLFNDGDFSNHGDLFANDSIYSIKLDSTFGVDKIGLHRFNYHVEDSFYEENLGVPLHQIFIENKNGEFLNISVPDSIKKPSSPSIYNRELITVDVTDPQGLEDIDSVYFYSLKPNDSLANNGNPLPMVDNGLPFNELNPWIYTGDEVEGDGIYSLSILIFGDPETLLGKYIFSFYIRDLVGNLSKVIKDSIIVY